MRVFGFIASFVFALYNFWNIGTILEISPFYAMFFFLSGIAWLWVALNFITIRGIRIEKDN